MSRHQTMLRALVRLGKTPDRIAADVPMDVKNVAANLKHDWPIRKRFAGPLEDYAREVLRDCYPTASEPERAAIAEAYLRAFGQSIHDAPPALSDAAHRAAFVAWLLRVPIGEVFPHGPECTPDGNEALELAMHALVRRLHDEARRARDRSPEAVSYIRTLQHADAVMHGREDPPASGDFESRAGYRRGMYIFRPNPKPRGGAA